MLDLKPESKACAEIERLLVFYASDELDSTERALVEAHTRQCAACETSLARELRLRQAVLGAERAREGEPSDVLLAQCRSELAEVVDDLGETRPRASWLDALRPSRWMVPPFLAHPALSVVALVLIGAVVGLGLPQWYRSHRTQRSERAAMTVSAWRLTDQDLETMGIAGINWVPDSGSGTPRVELRLLAERPFELQGSLDDPDVKRVLTYVIQNGQRFDSGVRLDSVDVLRTHLADRDVRQALCAAARKDDNPGVRLRALEALRGFEQEDVVRQTLLEALANDANPGVRVEAINSLGGALRAMAEKGTMSQDLRLVNVLRERMQKDPNNYVRMQCSEAVRQLGPRELY
ncbi:MAG TPA: HEAT repeat domain-containing protein [Candidatus Acidoferrales bacterium]|nr:HEAT repeat domain-containing protein [Candidatus Acidoferrales bacterium]